MPAKLDLFPAVPVAQEAIVPDLDEPLGQDVQKETANELGSGQGHEFGLPVVLVVPPFEGYAAVFRGNDPAVGDRHPMGIETEIAEDVFRTGKGLLTVNHPFHSVKPVQKLLEGCRRIRDSGREREPAIPVSLFEQGEELAPELAGEHLDRDKELLARCDPA